MEPGHLSAYENSCLHGTWTLTDLNRLAIALRIAILGKEWVSDGNEAEQTFLEMIVEGTLD